MADQYSVDPAENISIEMASSSPEQQRVFNALSVAPTNYQTVLNEQQKNFIAAQQHADLTTKLYPILERLSGLEEEIAVNKTMQSAKLKENQALYDSLVAERDSLKSSQSGMTGGAYREISIGPDQYKQDVSREATNLSTLKTQLETAQRESDIQQADIILDKIKTSQEKMEKLLNTDPWTDTEKYPLKKESVHYINPTQYASGYGVGGYFGFGEGAGARRDILEGNVTGGTIGASTPELRAEAAMKAAGITATPELTSSDVKSIMERFNKNPYDESLSQNDRIIATSVNSLQDTTSKYSPAGLAGVAERLINSGLSKNEAIKVISNTPQTGSIAFNSITGILAAQEAAKTRLHEQILSQPEGKPAIASSPEVNLITGESGAKKPFLSIATGSIANAHEVAEGKPEEANWLARITDSVSGTPLGSAITGKSVSPEAKRFSDLINFASPALGVAVPSWAKIPGVEKASTFIDRIFGTKATSSILRGSTSAIIPGSLSLSAGTRIEKTPEGGSGAMWTDLKMPTTKTPTMKELNEKPAKTGLFSRDWFEKQAGEPGIISAARLPGAYGAGGLTKEGLLGGGKSEDAYGKFMATYNPEEIKTAAKITTPNNETYYVIVGKQGEYQIRNDLWGGERWSADQGEGAFNQLMKQGIDPIATILARESNPDASIKFGQTGSQYKSSEDFQKTLQKNAIDLQNPSEIEAFATKNVQRAKDMVTLKDAQNEAYQTVLLHRWERDTGKAVGSMSISDYMKANEKPTIGDTIQTINRAINPIRASALEQNTETKLISSKYQLPNVKSGILDQNPFPTEPVSDSKQYGDLKRYEGVINASIDNNKPISQSYIADLDKTSLSESQKFTLRGWISAYNTSMKEQNSLIEVLSDENHIPDYDKLYAKALDISKYSPTMAATMYLNVEQREKVDRANAILPELSDPLLDSKTRASREKELNSLISGINDPDLKSKYSALPAEFKTFSSLVTELNTTSPKSVPFEVKDTKIQEFNQKVDSQLPDFDTKTKNELKSNYVQVIEGAVIPEKVRSLSFGGMISDFTKAYGALKSGDVIGGYENYQQGISRYTTRAVIPDITGFAKSIEQTPGALNTPVGQGVVLAAGFGESVYTNIREKPIEDVALYFLPGAFKFGEYGITRVIAGAVKADLPIITTAGRAASTPIAGDVGTLAKLTLGGIYAYQSGQHILGGEDKSALGYGQRSGDVAYQISMMGLGTKAVPEMPPVDNPNIGKQFFSGERGFSPLEVARQTISAKINSYSISKSQEGARDAYTAIPKIFRKVRYIEPQPGITETTTVKPYAEPDISRAQSIGPQRAPAIRAALAEEPHSILGSMVMETQKTGLKTGDLLRTPPHDVDVRVNSPENLDKLLAALGETSAGLDVQPFEKGYPNIPGRTNPGEDKGVTITSWGTRLFGEPIPNEQGHKLPVLDEVLLAGRDYPGVLSQEKMNVQFARKSQALMQDMLPESAKTGNAEARALNEEFRLPKDWYDFQSIGRDLVSGKQAASGEKVGTSTKPTTGLTDMEATKWKFNFKAREDNPIIGAKAGKKFEKEMTFKQIKDLYERAILEERSARKTGGGGKNREVEYEVSKAKLSSRGAIQSASSFTQKFAPGSIITSAKNQISTRSPLSNFKSSVVSSKSTIASSLPLKSQYSPSYSTYSGVKYSPSVILSPGISSPAVSTPSYTPPYSPAYSPSYAPSSKPSYQPSFQPSYRPSYNQSPYRSSLFVPGITIVPPLLRGGLGGGGGDDTKKRRRIKRFGIRQPIVNPTSFFSGYEMPVISYNIGGGGKGETTVINVQKRIKKLYA